jgi:septal ring factor EnvC (AmiA/AmiB activator)
MTDGLQEPEVSLVKRLRESGTRSEVELHEDREEAADRIEQLEREREELQKDADEADSYAWQLEARLDKLAEVEKERALLDKVVELLKEARQDLEVYVTKDWPKDAHPVYERKWNRDMELCRRIDPVLDAALADIREGRG